MAAFAPTNSGGQCDLGIPLGWYPEPMCFKAKGNPEYELERDAYIISCCAVADGNYELLSVSFSGKTTGNDELIDKLGRRYGEVLRLRIAMINDNSQQYIGGFGQCMGLEEELVEVVVEGEGVRSGYRKISSSEVAATLCSSGDVLKINEPLFGIDRRENSFQIFLVYELPAQRLYGIRGWNYGASKETAKRQKTKLPEEWIKYMLLEAKITLSKHSHY
ncbi:hypothetical protein B0H17DRAFT_1147864 [Mycena rosella]|uniref:Uncharacterized protein n=1 Tax=Mycena rosella TaxID=1033263 RepID=A0AAD7CH79_MYCRO|nr:hypothetical protein B0H17DRAFT_1147864 [Mycena rosella]